MTLSSTSRPAIRGRVLTRLPATLSASGGLAVNKVNGVWTFSPDWTVLDLETSLAEPESRHLWVLNPGTEVYTRLSVSALMASALVGTSSTSLAVATGSNTWITQAGKGWSVGQRLRAASDDGTKVMEGEVTAYSSTSLTIDVDRVEGSGDHADWNITIAGMEGPAAWSAPAAWATATAYVASPPASVVTQDGETYVCLVNHTSGTFATDLAASKWIKVAAKGADGDVIGPGGSVDGEVALFDGTGGATLRRATGSGIPKLTSGVQSIATAGTDYMKPGTASDLNGAGYYQTTTYNNGTKSSGTFTFDPTLGQVQKVTNGGAHTFAPPSGKYGSWTIDYINSASPGALTTSGWTKVDGDPFDTVSGHVFICMMRVSDQGSYLSVKRLV